MDQRGGLLGLQARLAQLTGVPGDDPAGDCQPRLLCAGACGQVTQDLQPGGWVAGSGERTGLFDAQIGQAVAGDRAGGRGIRARGAPVAGGEAQIADLLRGGGRCVARDAAVSQSVGCR